MKKLFALICLLGFPSLSTNELPVREYKKHRQELQKTREIVVRQVGDPVCVESRTPAGTSEQYAQIQCSFVLNVYRIFNQNLYGLVKEGWFENEEDLIGTKKLQIEEAETVVFKGQKHAIFGESLKSIDASTDLKESALTVDKIILNTFAQRRLAADLKAAQELCKNRHAYYAQKQGQKTVMHSEKDY